MTINSPDPWPLSKDVLKGAGRCFLLAVVVIGDVAADSCAGDGDAVVDGGQTR